jgi:hypothetical protein
MREIKFRVWDKHHKQFLPVEVYNIVSLTSFNAFGVMRKEWMDYSEGEYFYEKSQILEQFTGLQDKDGVDYCVGDLVNVFFTSDNGEHIHDCIYQVLKGSLGGIELRYKSLLWESEGWNQYTLHSTLSEKYSRLSEDYLNRGKLMLEDSYGENHMTRDRWKEIDESRYFKIIGNIHENKELLCEN